MKRKKKKFSFEGLFIGFWIGVMGLFVLIAIIGICYMALESFLALDTLVKIVLGCILGLGIIIGIWLGFNWE